MLEKLKKWGVLHSGCSGRGKWARGNAPKRRREEVRKGRRRTSCKKGEEVGAAVHEREEEKNKDMSNFVNYFIKKTFQLSCNASKAS